MWGQASALVHIIRQANRAIPGHRSGEFAGVGIALKMVWWAADKSIVQRSALIAGLSLALGGITLAGIGEWSAGHVDSSAAEGRPPASLAASSYSGSSVTAAPSALLDLPDPSDHMPANSPGYTFRHDVPEVRLQFTVADERGRLVNDLTSGDVRVFDNQSPVAHFNQFERDNDLPLQLGLLLDTSDSVKRILPQEKRAAIDFLDQVMRPQTDDAFIIAFGGDY